MVVLGSKIRVENFKCIEDSEEFTIGETTCLVGKNESGKTALLEALYKLNPVIDTEGKFEKREFPRRAWDDFDTKAKSLTTTWELDDDDVEAVEEVLGPDCVDSTQVVVTKGYNNQQLWAIRLDESAIVQALTERADLTPVATERLSNITTIADLAAKLAPGETKGEEALGELLAEEIPEENAVRVAISVLKDRLPVFLYFPEYAVMPGRVAINDLTRKRDEGRLDIRDEIFLALLALVGNRPEDIAEITHTEDLIAELEGVSSSLSDEIFDYWSQNRHLQVDFKFLMGRTGDPAPYNEGWVFETRIRNLRHRATVNFDERSSGFTWFFSFLVWFSLLKDTYGDRLFLLLDEPGLSLHARAQGDLLRFFRERLVPSHQLIYTTHSPFMVDSDNLTSARTVEDVVTKEEDQEVLHGTKVGDRILSTERDTIFPLYAALGYDITQTLFVGKNTVLVEGPSDLLFMKRASNQLVERGREGLDPRWTISPAGGIDKVSSFITLFGGIDLNIAVLADYHSGVRGKVKTLRESELLKSGHVLTAETYTDGDEADIEDILGRDNYVALINASMDWTGDRAMPDIKPDEAPVRVVLEVDAHNRTLDAEAADLDHYKPSVYLTEHQADLELPDFESALTRFEALFSDLNGLFELE